MEEVIVRPAVLDDLEVLLRFEQAIIETERPFDPSIRAGENVHYYNLESLVRSPESEVVVAEVNAIIVGSGYARVEESKLYLEHRKHSYLGFMYVVPKHRGQGVNKRIIEALERWSRSRGIYEMRLEVYAANFGAIKAYEKSGYSGNVLEMRKRLSQN